MPKPICPTPLYRIDECPDLMADACLCDEHGILIFASLWGRDTAIQEFLARLTLESDERGLDRFHLLTEQESVVPVAIGNIDRLKKHTTRTIPGTLFGSMIHLWLFDSRCKKPDKANATALAIFPKDTSDRMQKLWMLVQETCPLPLLDHWRDSVLDLLQSKSCLTPLPFSLGDLEGHQLAIDVPALTEALGELIREGMLDTSPREVSQPEPLRRVA
jgi:hypothetical protein